MKPDDYLPSDAAFEVFLATCGTRLNEFEQALLRHHRYLALKETA